MSKLKINGEKLKRLIQTSRFKTQTAFAKYIDRSLASVSRWVNEKTVPTKTIYIICDALECDIEDLRRD